MLIYLSSSLFFSGVLNGAQAQPDFWDRAQQSGLVSTGVVLQDGERWILQVENPGFGTHPLLVWEKPDIGSSFYAITGEVRGQAVGSAYLEMWSVFPDGSRYFTRTLSQSGPMGLMSGDFDWRTFQVPFDTLGKVPAPVSLELNLHVEGGGTVELGPLSLIATSSRPAWVVLAGVLLGMLGAMVGVLAGLGKGRAWAMAGLAGMAVVGFSCLAWGILQWRTGQTPATAWMLGGLGVLLAMSLRRTLLNRYNQLESRRMAAMDKI